MKIIPHLQLPLNRVRAGFRLSRSRRWYRGLLFTGNSTRCITLFTSRTATGSAQWDRAHIVSTRNTYHVVRPGYYGLVVLADVCRADTLTHAL